MGVAAHESARRLDSWKEIAAHLGREVRTVQRWEKEEGLPVHRHAHKKLGSVYAYVPEIDAWSKSRRALLEGETKPPAGRRKWWLWVAASGAVVVAGALLGWRLTQRPAGQQTVLRQLTTDTGLTCQPALSPDGKLLAYASDRSGQGNLDIHVQQLPRDQPIRLTDHEADDYEPSFSPDGTRIVYASDRDGGGIYVIPALGGETRKIAVQNRSHRPRYSPDGQWIAYWAGSPHSTGIVFVVPASGGQPRRLLPESAPARSPVWTPDGKHLLVKANLDWGSNAPRAWDWWVASLDGSPPVKTGADEAFRRLRLEPFGTNNIFPEVWIPGNNQVVFSARSGDSVNLWRITISPKTWSVLGDPQRLTYGSGLEQHASAGAGGRLVFSSLARNLDIWSLPIDTSRGTRTGELEQLTHGAAEESSPSVSDDGKHMAFESNRTGKRLVWTKDLETGKEQALTDTPSIENLPRISHDGSKVAYAIIKKLGPESHFEIHAIPYVGGASTKVCQGCYFPSDWSRDGNRILCHGPAKTVDLVNIASGEHVILLQHPNYSFWNGQFTPDGRGITFGAVLEPGQPAQRFLAPVGGAAPIPESQWIPLSGPGAGGNKWSPDGTLLYGASERDGSLCIWAQSVDRETKLPVGEPFALYHLHGARRSLRNVGDPALWGMSVARDKFVFTLGELTGNIWMMEPQEPQSK